MIGDRTARIAGGVTCGAALLFLIGTACGGRQPSLAARRLVSDAMIREGCYRCLDEAVVRYLGMPPARPSVMRVNDTQLFRALVLLSLREKELGLDPTQHLRQARLVAPRTTASAVALEQLKWAELIPSNPSALPRDVIDAESARLGAVREELRQRLARASAMSDPLDVYLNVSLACSSGARAELPDPEAVAAPGISEPIVQWRLAICGRTREDALRAFATAQPRYVEADYWIGRYRAAFGSASGPRLTLGSSPAGRREARERMQAALTAIPGALAVAFDLAGVTQVTSPREALPLYQRVTRAQPRHNEAWLGQGISLTYLERPREAIDALTKVLELGRWAVGDAYYYRAWNRHAIGELDAAWADTENARTTLYNTDVLALSGRIAFDQGRLDVARPLLEKALELSETNCGAAWYLGLVHSTQERWLAGGETFGTAETCYRADIERTRAEQARAADEVEESERAARQASAEASIRVSARQAALSAYNAAFAFVRGGDTARSRPLLDRAVEHPEVSDRARELRAFVDR
jgi:tetratricopeptide (TPR) repeat protein